MPVPKPNPPKKTYPPEFKQNAVKLITEFGRSYQDTANQLGCTTQSIRHWVAQHLAQLEPQKRTEPSKPRQSLLLSHSPTTLPLWFTHLA